MRFLRLVAVGVVLLVVVGSILGMACAGAKGEQGPQGPKGDTGVDGVGVKNIVNNGDGTFTVNLTNGGAYTTDDLTGPQGEKGDAGLPGAGIAWQGEWSNVATYSLNDAVGYQGSSYVSKQDGNTNHLPTDTAWWELWVAKGDTGTQGPQGVQGTQGEKGDTGDQGLQGAQGIQGVPGEPGPNMIVAMGYIRTNGSIDDTQRYNITSCAWDATNMRFDIVLTGIDYLVSDYVTLATSLYGHSASVGSLGGHLLVYIRDSAGNPVQYQFSFAVLDLTP